LNAATDQIAPAARGRRRAALVGALILLALPQACSGPRRIRLPEASAWRPPSPLNACDPTGGGGTALEVGASPAPAPISSSPSGAVSIDLAQVLELAAEADLATRIAIEQAQEAFAQTDLVAESLYPSVSVGLRRGERTGSFQTTAGNFLDVDARQDFRGPALELSFDPGRAVFTLAAARERAEGRTFATLTAHQAAMLRAGLGFVALQEAHALVAAAEGSLARADDQLADQRARRGSGAGHEGDLQEALAQRARAYDRLLGRRAETQLSSARLAELVGLAPERPLTPRGSEFVALEMVALGNLSDLVELALERRSEVAQAQSSVRAAQRERTLRSWRWAIPTLEGIAEAGEVGPNDDDLEHTEAYSISLQWDLGATLSGEIHRSAALAREAGFVLEAVRRRVAREVVEAFRAAQAMRERGDVLGEAERAARAALEQAALRFASSDRLLMELQRADELVTAMQERRIGALADYCRAQLALFAAVGGGGEWGLPALLPDPGPSRRP
jgi:outer membrane protein TolC